MGLVEKLYQPQRSLVPVGFNIKGSSDSAYFRYTMENVAHMIMDLDNQ